MCSARLAGNAAPQKSPKSRHLGTIAQLCRAMSSQLRHVTTIRKNLLNANIFPTWPHNMVNFGPLATEICWQVWGTPANFNGFCVLAALLHGTLAVGRQPNFAALNRRRHLYSAGRRWASSTFLVVIMEQFVLLKCSEIFRVGQRHFLVAVWHHYNITVLQSADS